MDLNFMKTTDIEKKAAGRRGEDLAAEYLQGLGHIILDRNWRSGHLEIDIVSLADDGLHFVEVKCRKAPFTAEPETAITGTKMQNIVKAAHRYLHSPDARKLAGNRPEIFFDAVTVVIYNNTKTDINYYPRVYTPLYI